MPLADPAEIRARFGLAPRPTAIPEDEEDEPKVLDDRALAVRRRFGLDPDPERAAARERIERMKAEGEAQWSRIEEQQPGNVAVETLRGVGRTVTDPDVYRRGLEPWRQGGAAMVRSALSAEEGLAGAIEAGGVALGKYGERLQRQGEERREQTGAPSSAMTTVGAGLEAAAPAIRERGAEAAESARTEREQGVYKRPPDFPEDIWQGLAERPLETLALHGLENLGPLAVSLGAAAAGGWPAVLTTSFAQEGGAAWNEAKAEGASDDDALKAFVLTGAGNTALESLPAAMAIQRLAGRGVPKDEVARVVGGMAEQAFAGGITESFQEFNNILVSTLTYAKDHEWGWEDIKRIGASGLIGLVLEGGVGLATSGTAPQETPPPTKPPQEVPATPPPPAAQPASPPPPPPAEAPIPRSREEAAPAEPAEGEIQFVDEEPGAMEHAGSATSPESIARQAGGTRFLRIAPGGESTPIPGVEAVDVSVRPGEVKVRVSPNGEMVVEQGRVNPAQQATLDRLQGVRERFAATVPQEPAEAPAGTQDAAANVEPATEAFNAPGEQSESTLSGIERLPAARPEEAGFVQASSPGLARDIKAAIDRQIKPWGNLPKSAWRLKLQKDHNLGAHEKGLEFRLRELNQRIRRYDGPLTKKQLVRYLGDALRGNVPVKVGAETTLADETQMQRIADRRGLDVEDVRQEYARVAQRQPEGLASAPEFLPLLAKLRADIDATTRALRREGLLDDGAARDLERSHGLYTHRSYEAFRGASKKWLRRVEKTPLWNRAHELIAKRYPKLAPEEVDGWMRELIERGDRAVLPGNIPEGALNRSTLFQRQNEGEMERLLLGERRDIRAQAVDTVIGQVSLLEHHNFLKALREDGLGEYLFERPVGRFYRNIDEVAMPLAVLDEAGEASTIYRKGTNRRMGALTASGKPGGKALHTTPEILRELEDAMPKASEWPLWLKLWSLGNFAVKMNLTVLSPTTTGRNYLSNVFAALAQGYNPLGRGLREGKSVVFRDIANSSDEQLRELYQKFVRLGIMDQNADYGDLRRLGAFADLMRLETEPQARPVTWAKTFVRKAGQVYQHGDNFWKILGWSQERARLAKAHPDWSEGRLDQEAADIVGRVLQNYSELPRLARSISSNPVVAPFFSFTWAMFRNVKETAKQASTELRSDNPVIRRVGMKRTAGLIVALSLPEMLTFALRWMSNTDEEDDGALREFVYPWDRGSSLGIVSHKPGEYTYFNWGFMDYFSRLKEPVRLMLQAASGDRPAEEAGSDLLADYGEEVLLGALIDAARGETADGYRVWLEKDSFDDRLGKSVEHLWKTARPGVARNIANLQDAAAGRRNRKLWIELIALLGPRFTTVNVRDRLDRYGSGFSRDLGEATRVYSQYSNRSDDPGEEKFLEGYRRANEERAKLLYELRRKMDAAVVSGIPVDEVEKVLDDAGVPGKYIRMAWGEEFEAVDYSRGPHWEKYEDALKKAAEEAVKAWEPGGGP